MRLFLNRLFYRVHFIFLSSYFSEKKYRKEFAKERNRFLDIIKKVNNNELDMIIDNDIVYNSLKLRNESLELYFKKISETDLNNKLSNSKADILLSLMHMFCNRYKGDTLWELKIMTILRHSIYSLNQKNSKLIYEKN
ncbi:lantibiotic dehydratase C-terminal domain-containing protein [Terrisporobacter sp.]|uniref:lantibiotic dehydratase C-terminal domain-containing protein n=1 Tax=Terrisporobacter sp. TaxID=1965305 RepID=UPI003FCC47A8